VRPPGISPVTGLSLRALAFLTGHDHARLLTVLEAERERGRVELDELGRYRLVPEAFTPAVLAALRRLERDTQRKLRP
jgi:hypothetical protein